MNRRAKDLPNNLDRSLIASAAIELMDEIGIDALKVRRLAERLGVKGPALYWHFRSKEDLLGAMCEVLLATSASHNLDAGGWREWLAEMAVKFRATMLTVRDGGRLVVMASWSDRVRSDLFGRLLLPLVKAGFPEVAARQMVAAVTSYALGWVAIEEREDHRHFMQEVFDIDDTFHKGLRAMISGFDGPPIA